jgi:ATP-binding cassette subfamily B protein RaxB
MTARLSIVVPSHLFRHMASLPASWFEARSSADIINRLDSANAIQRTLTTSVIGAVVDGVVVIIASVVMVSYDFALAAIVFVAFLACGSVRLLWYNVYRQMSAGALVQAARIQETLWETMRGIATIKQFNGEDRRREKYLALISRMVRLQNGIATTVTGFSFVNDLVFTAERVAILYLGAGAVMANGFSVGMLVAFLSFRENFVGKASKLIDAIIEFRMLGIHLDRLSDILLTSPQNQHKLPFSGDRVIRGLIEAHQISYRYGESDAAVLQDFSMRVSPGEIVAISGRSGTGKSTLLKILAGQIEPCDGRVLIDGVPMNSIALERFREAIILVRQDDTLFAGTITENIAFIQEQPDHQRVMQCAMKVGIHDEIQKMPMGYNTLLGSWGAGLSGGQSQRLILARALYRRPSILLLDEATSHLDLHNDLLIAKTLRELNITQVIVAHRPGTIAHADRIIEI